MIKIGNLEVAEAENSEVPGVRQFIPREKEMELCFAAWNFTADGKPLLGDDVPPLHFRLEGPPGVGKNEIVYEMARRLKKPLYLIQGHEELTPEDLGLILVPDPGGSFRDSPLMLRASPLATAIHVGGLFFFDEINRVPERTLSPLASVLDSRQTIYSALAGVHIGPKDARARSSFRFCCALNPALSDAGRGVLPGYIEERTLPVITIPYLRAEDLIKMVQTNLMPSAAFLSAFEDWYKRKSRTDVSARQAITLMKYAMSLAGGNAGKEADALAKAEPMIFQSAGAPGSGEAASALNDEAQDKRDEEDKAEGAPV